MNEKPEEKQTNEQKQKLSEADLKKAIAALGLGVKVVLDPSEALLYSN